MPDFKDLNPILLNSQTSLPNLPNPSTPSPDDYMALGAGAGTDLSGRPIDPIFGNGPIVSPMLPTATAKELYDSRRYKMFSNDIVDQEDQSANAQAELEKATNGVLKGLNLAGTTVAGGFGMLYGSVSSLATGRLADVWDNPIMQNLDKWNNEVDQTYLPNYYSNKESNASWYSSDNWFTTNFLFDKLIKNSGFAVGAMVSGNIANSALGAFGSTVGALASESAIAAESSQAFRIFSPLLRNTARAFSAGKNVEAAGVMEAELSSIADVTARSSQMAKIAKTTNQFAGMSDAVRRTAIAVYSSAGEASFEALQTSNQYRDSLISEFQKQNGIAPEGADLQQINEEADKVGKTSFLGNMALLSVTEYTQLPYLMGSSYSASKQAANSLMGQVDDVLLSEGKYIAKGVPATRFGKILDRGARYGKYIFDPKEAGQEIGQYALQIGAQNYYDKARRTKDANVLVDGVMYGFVGEDKNGKGVGALNSKEGIESGLLGGLTGGLMQTRANIKEGRTTKANTSTFLNQLNATPSFRQAFEDRLDGANRGIVLQQEQQAAVIAGDRLEAQDLTTDMMHNYLSTRIKYGRFDMVMDDINELKQFAITEEGLASLKEQGVANINDTVISYQQRLNDFQVVAKNTEEIYKSTNLRFSGQVVTDAEGQAVLVDGKPVRKYSQPVIDKMVYAASKMADYDLRIPKVSMSVVTGGVDVQGVVNDSLTSDSPVELAKAIALIEDSGNELTKDDLKQSLKDVVELSLRRKFFLEQYKDMKDNPERYTSYGERKEVNEEGKKVRTTQPSNEDSKYTALSRNAFKSDVRTYEDLVKQYGEGEQSKYDVLKKMTNSPFATTIEKELASQFLKYTPRDSNIILGDRTLPHPGVSQNGVSRINYEALAHDYEGTPMVAEHVILHEIGHDLTVKELSDPNSSFTKQLTPIYEFVQEHFKNDENKFADNGLIKSGEFYAFKNIYEFATEALSNRDFQRYLSTIPYEKTETSVWDNFIGTLKKFFRRLFNIDEDTALDETVAIVTNNIDKLYKSVKEQNKKLGEEEERQKLAAEKLKKITASLRKQLDEVEQSSATIGTEDTSTASVFEEPKKEASILFKSSITESEDWNDPTQSAPHIKRSREFLNKVDSFPNRGDIKAILVTPNQVDALGLQGMVQMSYGAEPTVDVSEIPEVLDNDRGFVAQVYILQQKGKDYFVDKNGKKLTQVGKPADLNNVVFQTMPTTALHTSRGTASFRTEQEEEATAYAKAWEDFRKTLFSAPVDSFSVYDFDVSRGIPIENIVGGIKEQNHVEGILVPKKVIETNQTLITIPTTGTITHNGHLLKYPNGVPVLQYGSTIQILNNKKFNDNEAKTIYKVLNSLVLDVFAQTEKSKTIRINRDYTTFLQNVLYMRKGDTASGNHININPDRQEISLGELKYSFTDIAQKEQEIVEHLRNSFNAINNKTLKDKFVEPFLEYYLDGKNQLKSREWENYQTYLLSGKTPDGKARSGENTPLTTSVAAATEAIPYSFKQKYSTIEALELNVTKPEVVKEVVTPKAQAVAAEVDKIGDFVMDGVSTNTYTGFTSGPVDFTGTVDEAGNVTVNVIPNDTIEKVASNPTVVNGTIVPVLKAIGIFDAEQSDEQMVVSFVANKLAAELNKLEKAKTPVVEAPVVETSITKESVQAELKTASDLYDLLNYGKIEGDYDAALADVQRLTKLLATFEVSEKKPNKFGGFSGPSSEYRRIGTDNIDRSTDAEYQLFQKWHSENVPNIPFEMLDRILTTHDGEKAWGAFENNVAKIVKGGLRGTEYHEIFEGIYKGMLSSEQQQALLDEFKSQPGNFIDRQTGKTVKRDEATDLQAKERIADDFADFRIGKLPARNLTEAIRNFFKNIIEFFKSFVVKPTMKQNLFKAIDAGEFKDKFLSTPEDNPFAEYRAVEGLTEQQTHEFVQDMTARAAGILYAEGNKQLLFNPLKITSGDMFAKIEYQYSQETNSQGESKLDLLGTTAWTQLKQRTKQSLRTLGIEFNEDDVLDINDETVNKNDYAKEAFSTDWKQSSTGAIKFSLATLLQVQATNQEKSLHLQMPDAVHSSVGGYKLLNFSRAFATVLDKLSNTTAISDVVNKLANLAKYDPNYVRLFKRVGGNLTNKTIPFSEFNNTDWRYFIQFMQTFTKQKPEALIQYKSGGEVYTAPANLFTAIKQTQYSWIENIKTLAKDETSLITYNQKDKEYKVKSDELSAMPIKTPKDMVTFLGNIGVEFPMDVYNNLKSKGTTRKSSQQATFASAVSALHTYLGTQNTIMTVSGKTLGINGQLVTLAELYNKVTNPSHESTYFGVDNQRIGAFSDNNTPSVFENEFNESNTLQELLEKRPELNDIFSTNSQILKPGGLFFDKNGKRIKSLKVEVIQGTKDIDNNKGTSTTQLTLGDRFVQEINQNLSGKYYILIPADGSTEWMMNLDNTIKFNEIESGRAWDKVNDIFKGYLLDEIDLAMDFENRQTLKSVGAKAKELRFFKDILNTDTLDDINQMLKDENIREDIIEYINQNIDVINKDIQAYILSTTSETNDILTSNRQVINIGEDEYTWPGLDDNFYKKEELNKYKLSEKSVNDIITFANVNYIINNIEYHKFIFGDPYQFAVKKDGSLDETKRIKSFLSPRRTTFDSPEYNTFLNQNMNSVGDIELMSGDPGYQNFKSYTNTITLQDVEVVGSLVDTLEAYGATNEADAASWIMDGTYREVKLKNGQWTDVAEEWHQWQMAYTRQNLPKYEYTNEELKQHDAELVRKPAPKHLIEVLKPIVSGNKYDKTNIDLVLDKFSQMPMYYSMVRGTKMEKLYIKMLESGHGYAIMESGRKVGAEQLHSLYNNDGTFNDEPFNNTIQVPWKAYGIQVETTVENEKSQTRGSQLTKLSSMDLFDNGVPASDEARTEYLHNKDILDKMHDNAYNELLVKLGVEDMGNGFRLVDGKVISDTLMTEMLRREMSDNAKDTIQLDENNQFRIPFEASPSYIQIRNILYSMINKSIISPKMSGGAHVQVPATMFEAATENRGLALKVGKEWKKITREEYLKLPEEEHKNVALTDDNLKFYTEEQPYCEIMLPAWFKEKLNFRNDKDLLAYLNKTADGQAILRGIGFRIPTQSLSSIEVFKVKGFLPKYMGATVVVPSEITTKSGSDFDIDKLNMYLKSIYIDRTGDVRLIRYQGSELATKEFFGKVFDDTLLVKQMKKQDIIEAIDIIVYDLEDPNNLLNKYGTYLKNMSNEYANPFDYREVLMKTIEELTDENIQSELKAQYVKEMYKKSLENEYYESLERLVTLPENFNRLISPVDDAGLKGISQELDELRGYNESGIKNRILNRNYMTNLRHSFSIAKKWVGIAATSITNHSIAQKSKIHIDDAKIRLLNRRDQEILGDGSVILPHNTVLIDGIERVSMSGKTDADGEMYISDGLSGYATTFVDVAKDPYILKIIQSDTAIGTFMFLQRIGVPLKTSALFMNQPIISEYLNYLDSVSERNLFKQANINLIKNNFVASDEEVKNATINLDMLAGNIKDFYENGIFKSSEDNAIQHKVLDEFLKYAKMAEFNFKFTQSVNYDTSKFRSAESLSRKQWRTQIARDTNIISNVQDILDTTFIGPQEKLLDKSTEAMGAILKLDGGALREITNSVLRSFGQNEYLSNDKFEKIGNEVKSAFLDYIIQTKTDINTRIKELLVDDKTSVVVKLEKAKRRYPQMQILRDLQVVSGDRVNGAKSVKLAANIREAYDENLYTGYMRELRDYDSITNDLYKDLVALSILQGTYSSAISIRNIIPIEDFSDIVSPVIQGLVADGTLEAFTQGMYQRNNFRNPDIMPEFQPKFFSSSEAPIAEQQTAFGDHYADIYQYYSKAFPNIESMGIRSTERKVLLLNEQFNSFFLKNEYLKVPRVVTDKKTGEMIDVTTGRTITKMDFGKRKKAGDNSLKDVFGYKKVMLPNGEPLIYIKNLSYGQQEISHVYKLINLYGDGDRATENYEYFSPSVIDNGTMKVVEEISDAQLIEFYGGGLEEKVVSLPAPTNTDTDLNTNDFKC